MRQQQISLSRQYGAALLNLIVLLLVIAVGAAGWFGWHLLTAVSNDNDALREQIQMLQSEREGDLSLATQRNSATAERLDALDFSMASRDELLAQMQNGGQRNWLLNEAEALASLAQERLLLTADINAALRLLQASDKTLGRINDTRVLSARKALAVDMEKLRGAQQLDVQAIILQLGALQGLLDELVVPVTARDETVSEKPPLAADAGAWDKLLYSLPLIIRTQSSAFPLPLDAAQASSLRLYLDNSLQQAQLSLLQGKADGYRQALAQADKALLAWFDVNNTRVKHLHAALEDLGQVDVDQAMPEIGDGLKVIRGLQAEISQ